MQILKFENQGDWLEARRSKVTGSTLKNIASKGSVGKKQLTDALDAKGVEYKKADTIPVLKKLFKDSELVQMEVDGMLEEKKMGYYQLIADRLADPTDTDEHPMDRGNALEEEAIGVLEEELGKKLCREKVIWVREDNDKIAISPDTYEEAEKITDAYEVKCLGSAKHIKAKLTGEIPEEFIEQGYQYFVVNDDLVNLTFAFYDPRFIEGLKLHTITFTREDVIDQVEKYHLYQMDLLDDVDAVVKSLTF